MRLQAIIEYDGTEFAGWQRQATGRTVQGALEQALRSVTGEVVTVVGAGRTDAGVHATGQVAHFDTVWDRAVDELQRAVNAVLPDDVAVRVLDRAALGFHARHRATSRVYLYSVARGPVRSPIARRMSLHVAGRLDAVLMARAAALLVGTHDFAAFGRPMTPDGSTVRRVDGCEVHERGWRLLFQVEGNAFLRHQVRRMVGLMLDIGRGRLTLDAVAQVLARVADAPVARRVPPQGLMLAAVKYPPDEALVNDLASGGILIGEDGEGLSDIYSAAR